MNPKTGGTALMYFVSCMNACKGGNTFQGRFHTTLYRPDAYVTLREPCARTVSGYHHLKHVYSSHGECKPPLPSKCSKHWIHNMSFEHFVDILPNISQMWLPKHSASFNRHLVVVKPQSTWVQNGSKIICTNRLAQELQNLSENCNCSELNKNIGAYEKEAIQPSVCEKVKSIYKQDEAMFEANCRHQ